MWATGHASLLSSHVEDHANARLIATTDVPADTFSVDVELSELVCKQPRGDVCVRLSSAGRVEPVPRVGRASSCWIRAARLAGDCHTVNARLQRGRRRGCVLVRTLRHVTAGDELRLWFSEEMLAALRIPSFLAPSNIQGDRRYVCHRCSALFEFPNPLKLHLALDCGRDTEDDLWSRLLPGPETPLTTFTLPSPTASAFSPWSPRVQPPLLLRPPLPPSTAAAVTPVDLATHHARMESLVSSLGRSKRGHLCLYCGKLYSRKYGLKIHIRTHTGYKPLNCKYCMRPFGDPSNLNKHVRLHAEGDTPYKCDQCGKVLVRRRDLERHLKARHHAGSPISTCTATTTDDENST
ncbi:hypothetical protein B566_EDAN003872 [Ephemera danica]|nr:hypothetical protein B566_EDAN003872 [Ephemera danica]